MKGAVDTSGAQTHILSLVGQESTHPLAFFLAYAAFLLDCSGIKGSLDQPPFSEKFGVK